MKKVIMYEQIYKDIIKAIQNGVYKEKDMLPSEKEFADQYGVSRITTNKAMKMLVDQGIIERIQGKGSYVSANALEMLKTAEIEVPNEKSNNDFAEGTIGVILDNFDLDFGSDLIKGIERECRKQNWGMFFRCTYGSVEEENKGIQTALAHGAKGVILMPAQGEKYNDTVVRLALNHFPVVLLDREMKGMGISCVRTDNYAAAKELTEILIQHGHKKICFVTHVGQMTPSIEERENAFRDCMMEHPECQGMVEVFKSYNPTPEDSTQEYTDFEVAEIKEIIERAKDCTAIFAVEYKIGALFKLACAKLGIEREICTFDGLEGIFDDQNHFLHIKQGEYQMGMEAVQTLKKVIEGKDTELIINIPYKVIL